MKSISIFFISCLIGTAFANHPLSIIRSIDDIEKSRNYVEVSAEGLPREHYLQLLQQMNIFRFTFLSDSFTRDIFEDLTRNPRARMSSPGGRCSQRRAYIQNYLKKMNILSGKIVVRCPANNGRLRLQDQVSRRYFTYSNFHDANIVAVKTNAGTAFRVLDIQFQDNPVSLHDYLTEIEANQKIRPLKRRGPNNNLCHWAITTEFHSY